LPWSTCAMMAMFLISIIVYLTQYQHFTHLILFI